MADHRCAYCLGAPSDLRPRFTRQADEDEHALSHLRAALAAEPAFRDRIADLADRRPAEEQGDWARLAARGDRETYARALAGYWAALDETSEQLDRHLTPVQLDQLVDEHQGLTRRPAGWREVSPQASPAFQGGPWRDGRRVRSEQAQTIHLVARSLAARLDRDTTQAEVAAEHYTGESTLRKTRAALRRRRFT